MGLGGDDLARGGGDVQVGFEGLWKRAQRGVPR